MKRTILFLVHGMGMRATPPTGDATPAVAERGWYRDVVASLRALPPRYGIDLAFDMDARESMDPAQLGADAVGPRHRVTVIPVTYCDIFRNALEEVAETRKALGDAFAARGATVDQRLADLLEGRAAADAGFFWTHAMDVLLLRFDREVRTRVRLRIGATIAEAYTHYDAEDEDLPEAHIVAHSLGTFATADALQTLSSPSIREKVPAFRPNVFTVHSYATLANVSRILAGSPNDPYGWPVRPRTVTSPGPAEGMVRSFVDAAHRLDPFTWLHPFHAPPWTPAHDYAHRAPTAMKQLNVHGFSHYLDDPLVHCGMLNKLNLGFKQIPRAQAAQASAEHDAAAPTDPCAQEIVGLRAALEEVRTAPWSQQDLPELLRRAEAVWTRIEAARDACARRR